MGFIKQSLNDFIRIVRLNHGDIYSFEKTVYNGNDEYVTVTCLKHNCDITVKAVTLLRRTTRNGGRKKDPVVGSCPQCRVEYFDRIKKETLDKFRVVHNNEYEYVESTYVNYETPFTAICKLHGEFPVLGSTHIYGGHKCPKCYTSRGTDIRREKFIDDKRYYACDIHGNVPIGIYKKISKGCPVCNIERATQETNNQRREAVKKYFGNADVIFNPDESITITCKKHLTITIILKEDISKFYDRHTCDDCRQDAINANMNELKATSKIAKEELKLKVQRVLLYEYQNFYEYRNFIIDGLSPKECRVVLFNKITDRELTVPASSVLKKRLPKEQNMMQKVYLSYEDARVKVRALGITNFSEYKKWYKSAQPLDLPSNPHRTYKEWTTHCDFFGTNPKKNMSWGEKRIDDHLLAKNIKYVWQKKFNDCRDKNPLPFDFYLPEYNLIIEFDGQQHYKAVKKFGGEKHLLITQSHDKIKNKYCKDNDIKLIRLSYSDLTNNNIEYYLDVELASIHFDL